MPTYQPNIPTGIVPLNQDYQNLQGNFQQLNIAYGVDHVPFSDTSGIPPTVNGISGMHTSIHLNPVSTTTTNPPNNYPPVLPTATTGIGQLFSSEVNDGYSPDTALFFLSAGGNLTQLTSNVKPAPAGIGFTTLPGGVIMQWGTIGPTNAATSPVAFPKAFGTAIYNIQVTRSRAPLTPGAGFAYWVSNVGVTNAGFNIFNDDGHTWSYFWMAIGA